MSRFWMRFLPPLRPVEFDGPVPSGAVFAAGLAVCLLPYAVPRSYFCSIDFERGRLYARLGIRLFRLLAPKAAQTAPRDHIRGGYTGEPTRLAAGLVFNPYPALHQRYKRVRVRASFGTADADSP